jgi:5-methyltetrahydrofolate--homocysteine methyltransferase
MTTTLPNMERTVLAVRQAPHVPVLVGGAVVTPQVAVSLGAGYTEDAPGCVLAVRDAVARKEGLA